MQNDNSSLTRTEFQGTPTLVAREGLYSTETEKVVRNGEGKNQEMVESQEL